MTKKTAVLIIVGSLLFSGCSYFNKPAAPQIEQALPTASPQSASQPVLDGNIYNLLVTTNNFGIDEISATEGETVILSVRNQLEEPINVVIDELNVKSKNIEFGEVVEVTIPTDEPGEYEMYSSIGNQRQEGFSAMVYVDEMVEEEE